jgi:HMG box factor, other
MMPFDRVLPKPLALHVDPSRTYGSSGSLLEHKIMNDNVPTSMAEKASPMNPIFQQFNRNDGLEPHKQYPPCLSSRIHSINRDTVAKNETVSLTLSAKESPSRMTGSISPRDQSVTPSAYKSDPDVQTRMQFCLCQPDPKIPRPRNG